MASFGSADDSKAALSVSERRDRAVARVTASLERKSNAQLANAVDGAADTIPTERVELPSKNEVIHSNYVGSKAHKNFFQLYSEVQRERLLCLGGTVVRGTDPADGDRASLADDAGSVATSGLDLDDAVTQGFQAIRPYRPHHIKPTLPMRSRSPFMTLTIGSGGRQ